VDTTGTVDNEGLMTGGADADRSSALIAQRAEARPRAPLAVWVCGAAVGHVPPLAALVTCRKLCHEGV